MDFASKLIDCRLQQQSVINGIGGACCTCDCVNFGLRVPVCELLLFDF